MSDPNKNTITGITVTGFVIRDHGFSNADAVC